MKRSLLTLLIPIAMLPSLAHADCPFGYLAEITGYLPSSFYIDTQGGLLVPPQDDGRFTRWTLQNPGQPDQYFVIQDVTTRLLVSFWNECSMHIIYDADPLFLGNFED